MVVGEDGVIDINNCGSRCAAGGDGLFMVVDEGGVFREDNFQKAVTQLNDAGADGKHVRVCTTLCSHM
jgi:superfamily II RNA helicase